MRNAFSLALTVMLLPITAGAADKPNMLVIWGDDIGPFNISVYNGGVMGYTTPSIDRIANSFVP